MHGLACLLETSEPVLFARPKGNWHNLRILVYFSTLLINDWVDKSARPWFIARFARREPGMGFLSGRVTFRRFKVRGRSPGIFGPDHLKQLSNHAIGRQRTTS